MDRRRYNRFINQTIINLDKYSAADYELDQDYLEFKPRDVWTLISDPPYIVTGGNAALNTNPLLIDISALTALSSEFIEINVQQRLAFPLFDPTPGVINYLTAVYTRLEDFGSNRATFKNPSITYNAAVLDSGRFQWKLSAPIQPEQIGTATGPFDITASVNDNLVFATDQSNPEYIVALTTSVASATGFTLGSGSVYVSGGVNDTFNFTVDNVPYSLSLTSSGQVFTLSGVATQINSLAMIANPLLTMNIAFVIYNENRLRITSPRDGAPIVGKNVIIGNGNANTTLGFNTGTTSNEIPQRTAQNIADEINLVTSPEVTASSFSNRLKIQAQNPTGFLSLQNSLHSVFGTVGLTAPFQIFGAQSIDFNNDVILASAYVSGSTAVLSTTNRTHSIQVIDTHSGWEEHQSLSVPLYVLSGVPDDVTVTLSNFYVVGSHELEVFLSGKRITNTNGYDEVGTAGSRSQQVTIYSAINNQDAFFRVTNASPSNFPDLKVYEDSSLVIAGMSALDFGPEFSVTDAGLGKARIEIGTSGLSGTIMNHGFMHEFGGVQEINVNNLAGLLRFPQKSNVYVNGTLLYAPTGFNYTGVGVTITPFGSGAVNVNIPGNVFVDEAGDAKIRLGFAGGTAYTSLIIEDQLSGLWNLTVNNAGQLTTELVFSGTPVSVILQAANSGNLYQLGIERTLGSGELTTTLVTSGTPFLFSLISPNQKGWGVRVDSGGILSTLDPDNIFQVQNDAGQGIFTIFENGLVRLNQYNSGAISGNVDYLPTATIGSGCLAVYRNVSGQVFPIFSDGNLWYRVQMTPLF